MPTIIPTAEPFFFPGNQTGCLLIHGFTGTPKEMRWMGEFLHQQGYTVLGTRLTGHATRPADMARSRWTDWLASVEDGYHLLCGQVDHVYMIGLSMGGALSLLMATRLEVKGVVVISTPAYLPARIPIWLLQLLSWFRPYQPKSPGPPDQGWVDKQAFASHISYPQNPTRSAAELKRLLTAMRLALPQVRVPVLLIHSREDDYILPDNLETIYAGLANSPDKSKLYITGSGHVATRDAARRQVFEAAADFIRRVESG